MHERCSSCPRKDDGMCKCKDCQDICKKEPMGRSSREKEIDSIETSKARATSFWTARNTIKYLKDSEIILLLRMIYDEVSERGEKFSLTDDLYFSARELQSAANRLRDLRAAMPPMDFESHQGIRLKKVGFRPDGWWRKQKNDNQLNDAQKGNPKKNDGEEGNK